MDNLECGKCKIKLTVTDETIETIDFLSDYEMKVARVLICENCKCRFYIEEAKRV